MNETTVRSLEEMESFARSILGTLRPREDEKATVFGLRGELGAGKTAFVKAFAKEAGITDHVTSPTFVIQKIYPLKKGKEFLKLVHIDAYRLTNGDELKVLGWDDLISEAGTLVFLEWPEYVEDVMPVHTRFLDFTHIDEATRNIRS